MEADSAQLGLELQALAYSDVQVDHRDRRKRRHASGQPRFHQDSELVGSAEKAMLSTPS
jgi:hypothetical protein